MLLVHDSKFEPSPKTSDTDAVAFLLLYLTHFSPQILVKAADIRIILPSVSTLRTASLSTYVMRLLLFASWRKGRTECRLYLQNMN